MLGRYAAHAVSDYDRTDQCVSGKVDSLGKHSAEHAEADGGLFVFMLKLGQKGFSLGTLHPLSLAHGFDLVPRHAGENPVYLLQIYI